MRDPLFVVVACTLIVLAGCGPAIPQAKLDEAKQFVEQSLDAWKKGGKPASLKALPRPIDFTHDLWVRGNVLTGYEIQKTYYDSRDKIIRCTTSLTLRDRRGRPITEIAVYDVKLEPSVLIAHNPLP